MARIKITKGGIFGAEGEIAVGTELTLPDGVSAPEGWKGRYEEINGTNSDDGEQRRFLAANSGDMTAIKDDRGNRYSIKQGDNVLVGDLMKTEAEQFNAMSAEDKATYLNENVEQ